MNIEKFENFFHPSWWKKVKPFMLGIARDTSHASDLLAQIESTSFFDGNYKGFIQCLYAFF